MHRKEGRNGILKRFEHLTSYRDKIETPRNHEELPFSSRRVLSGVLGAEEPYTALRNAAHLYSNQAKPPGDPAEIRTYEFKLGSQAS